jgi:hypothetical protein
VYADPRGCSGLRRLPSREGPSYCEGPSGALTSKRQTGAPAVSAPVRHHSREPAGETAAGMICVSHRRYPMMVGRLQTKQHKGHPWRKSVHPVPNSVTVVFVI